MLLSEFAPRTITEGQLLDLTKSWQGYNRVVGEVIAFQGNKYSIKITVADGKGRLKVGDIIKLAPPFIKRMPVVTEVEQKINEFAPSQSRGDGDEDEEAILKTYAMRWYNGNLTVQKEIERVLRMQGWDIGEVESEEGGAFVVRLGDINGDSYIGWPEEELVINESVMPEMGYDNSLNITAERGGITLRAYIVTAGVLRIVAMAGGKEIGKTVFVDFGDSIQAMTVDVDERYRRQGIATLMYNFAEELGNDVDPSSALSDDGKAFWANRRPDTVNEDWKSALAGVAAVGAMIFGAPDANAITQQQYNQTAQMLASTPAQTLKKVAVASGITGNELAQFMAQCAHETAGFSTMKEQGGTLDFKKYDIKHNPRKAKALGNVKPGDGARFHGRGFIQLTGRDNYKRAGRALGLPLEQKPELVERPDVAAKVAVWFWKNHVKPKVSSYHDTAQVTKPINPAMRGLKDRETKFQAIKQGAMARPGELVPRGTKI